jgi:hypothetical protein
MRRAVACRIKPRKIGMMALWFYGSIAIEKVHPLQGGFIRRKYRRNRRPGLPLESPLTFYPRYVWELVSKSARFIALARTYHKIRKRVESDAARSSYRDLALTPVTQEEVGTLEIFSATESAKHAVERAQRLKAHRRSGAVAVAPLQDRSVHIPDTAVG